MQQNKFKEMEEVLQKEHDNIVGMMIVKDDICVYEKYFHDCHAQSSIHVYSITKSIISILIGIAIDKGYIKDVQQKVIDYFPEFTIKKREKTLPNITIEDLLTMRAPYKYKTVAGPYMRYFKSDDFAMFSLSLLGGKKDIGSFRYAPLIGLDILSAILVKATHQSVLEFAREHLFSHLQIQVKDNLYFDSKQAQMAFYNATDISGWVHDKKGIHTAGWGLTLSTKDLIKIGQLYLHEGTWGTTQIVSKQWVETSLQQHNFWEKENLAYGYLWWVNKSPHAGFAAIGDGGNVLYVDKEKQLIIAISASFKNRTKDRIAFIEQYIEPLFENE